MVGIGSRSPFGLKFRRDYIPKHSLSKFHRASDWKVSIPTIILLAVAIVTVHLPYGFSSIKLTSVTAGRPQFGPPGYECDLLYIACILALVLSGPSPLSIDAYRLRKERAALG
jgi:hypothetical protein